MRPASFFFTMRWAAERERKNDPDRLMSSVRFQIASVVAKAIAGSTIPALQTIKDGVPKSRSTRASHASTEADWVTSLRV